MSSTSNLPAKFHHAKHDSIIFDLDGTLWDSTEACLLAWTNILNNDASGSEPITREKLQSVFGMQHDLIGAHVFPHLSQSQRIQLIEMCFAEELRVIRCKGGALYSGLDSVLSELSNRYKLFIVSNCQSGYIESFFDFHKLDKYFGDFECSGNTKMPKQDNIKLIMDRNSLGKPLYVGDTQGDLDAAAENGIPFIHASYGFGKVADCKYVISALSELASIIEKIGK